MNMQSGAQLHKLFYPLTSGHKPEWQQGCRHHQLITLHDEIDCRRAFSVRVQDVGESDDRVASFVWKRGWSELQRDVKVAALSEVNTEVLWLWCKQSFWLRQDC